jgi:uncharacterized protein
LENFKELGLEGRVVFVKDKVKAYTFGYPVNSEVFCVYLETTDLSINGLAVHIFREFCNDAQVRKFKFINAMDDFCLKNIERTKLSFRPSVMLPSYAVACRN